MHVPEKQWQALSKSKRVLISSGSTQTLFDSTSTDQDIKLTRGTFDYYAYIENLFEREIEPTNTSLHK